MLLGPEKKFDDKKKPSLLTYRGKIQFIMISAKLREKENHFVIDTLVIYIFLRIFFKNFPYFRSYLWNRCGDGEDVMFFQNAWRIFSALFISGIIVGDSQHRKPSIHCEQYFNLRRSDSHKTTAAYFLFTIKNLLCLPLKFFFLL